MSNMNSDATETNLIQATPVDESKPDAQTTKGFDFTIIKKYPKSNRKVNIHFGAYSLFASDDGMEEAQSIHISPAGIEFHSHQPLSEGTLLKILVNIPDYWQRKRRFVEYRRVDQPARFSILAKVVRTEEVGRRGKKKMVTVQTVSIDETDELVLKSFLQEG